MQQGQQWVILTEQEKPYPNSKFRNNSFSRKTTMTPAATASEASYEMIPEKKNQMERMRKLKQGRVLQAAWKQICEDTDKFMKYAEQEWEAYMETRREQQLQQQQQQQEQQDQDTEQAQESHIEITPQIALPRETTDQQRDDQPRDQKEVSEGMKEEV